MNVFFFSAKEYEQPFFDKAFQEKGLEWNPVEFSLNKHSVEAVHNADAVCVFVNDTADRAVIERLAQQGVKLIALRCAGYNNVDLQAAHEHGIKVVRVPAYSPYAVAEHTLALILALNRKVHKAYNRVREGNFALDGLMGFDIYGKTAGIIGTGSIGTAAARILKGLGCRVLAYDLYPNEECKNIGVEYVPLEDIYKESDIITLHCPLTPDTHHLINETSIGQMKDGVMLINTSRGAIIDSKAVIEGLKSEKIGYLGMDVYEEEGDLFFRDLSDKVIKDDIFMRLLTFPNVLITGHQAFFTQNALENIAATTAANIEDFQKGAALKNEVVYESAHA